MQLEAQSQDCVAPCPFSGTLDANLKPRVVSAVPVISCKLRFHYLLYELDYKVIHKVGKRGITDKQVIILCKHSV